MPELPPGSVIHWKDYLTTHGKYFLVIGTSDEGTIYAFPITTQEHWLSSPIHRVSMIEIPQGATHFLPKRSFITCCFNLERISPVEYEQGVCDGEVTVKGCLRLDYLVKVKAVADNDLLEQRDIDDALKILNKVIPETKQRK